MPRTLPTFLRELPRMPLASAWCKRGQAPDLENSRKGSVHGFCQILLCEAHWQKRTLGAEETEALARFLFFQIGRLPEASWYHLSIMARRKKKKQLWLFPKLPSISVSLNPETVRSIYAILAAILALLFLLAPFELAGSVGSFLHAQLAGLFGTGYYLLPVSFAFLAIGLMRQHDEDGVGAARLIGAALLFVSGIGILALVSSGNTAGGMVGRWVMTPFVALFDTLLGGMMLAAVAIVGVLLALDTPLRLPVFLTQGKDAEKDEYEEADVEPEAYDEEEEEDEDKMPEEELEEEPSPKRGLFGASKPEKTTEEETGIAFTHSDTEYSPPPVSLLERDRGKPGMGDVKASANIIKRTLYNFGIDVEMDEVSIGPTVTRFALKPAEGVRLQKILGLQNNLELALAASPIRIEAPIPGKSLVGIEVPNVKKATVGLASLLSEKAFTDDQRPLISVLGRDITGTPHFANIGKMPHILIAGATGSGKTCGKDTYVFSEKGMLTFDELCPLPLNTESDYRLRVATRDGIETTSKNYNNGVCDFFKLTTEDGFSIEVTEEHPLWVIENGVMDWKSGGAIHVGDYVAISRGAKLFGADIPIAFTPKKPKSGVARVIRIPERMTKELGLFMGLLTADGGLTIGHRIVYTQANEAVLLLYQKLLEELFGITAPAVTKSGNSNKAKDVVVHSKHLKDFLASIGMGSARAQEKTIPRSIRESGKETIAAFIQGLMRNDGHISNAGLEITLANESLLKQLQIMLLNFGIVASLKPKKVKGYEQNAYWRLSVYGEDFAIYAEEIGFLTEEERERSARIVARKRNTNWNTVPTLSPLLKMLGKTYRDTFARLTNSGWQYAPDVLVPKYAFNSLRSYNSGDRRPSYPALGRILSLYQPLSAAPAFEQLRKIRDKDFYWARVARIEKTRGVGYDFEVPGSHSFVGNGFVNHNSVAIHALITSLLYRSGPATLRFIMVDPKRVELTLYNHIPHLLTPVITDPKKAILALKWAAKEMERRYDILESHAVRDISSYHENVVAKWDETSGEEAPDQMPYIVIVIDELADIMQTYPRELEAAIVRLAQMSRAVGIHLMLSTQRPSVNVVTGLIKANIPARIALQVASQIDSRTILDGPGAEKLLGAGDMLYLSGEMSKPRRIQTAFISETEVKKVVSYIKKNNESNLDEITLSGNADASPNAIFSAAFDDDADDDLYGEARRTVEEAGKASTSFLQRKLRIGYARAARLMDLLEDNGVIGPADGARPRDVLTAGGDDEYEEEEPAEDDKET